MIGIIIIFRPKKKKKMPDGLVGRLAWPTFDHHDDEQIQEGQT